ncbi:MAG: hypothetical protein K1000chlam2_00076 [Chlamydiae bacterium]|nr:hypothetical protein [Chlamydiota bacterium]
MEKALIALSILGIAGTAQAARGQENCAPTPPATCYADDCNRCYCLGPDNILVNAPVRPKTCNGDWMLTVAGFYWNAHQDGLEYAVDNHIENPNQGTTIPTISDIQQLNNVIDAEYKTPNFDWDWGFKVGLGYNTTCDGWDFGVMWTWYQGRANGKVEAEVDDNHTLVPLWSDFSSALGSVTYASDIQHHWKLKLNLIDLELGRQFWTSKYLSFRPHIGLRVAYLDQNFELQHKGGSWSSTDDTGNPQPLPFNNEVDLDNDFKGVGVRAGFDTNWNFGCGWAVYGNIATSIVYGRFSIDHDEENRIAEAPNSKIKILETEESFRASRAMLDLALGIQWSSMICSCQYGLTIMLGWEQHLFFHQNQLWRVVRIGDTATGSAGLPNNSGENVFHQRRGTLDTQGVTLTVRFEF